MFLKFIIEWCYIRFQNLCSFIHCLCSSAFCPDISSNDWLFESFLTLFSSKTGRSFWSRFQHALFNCFAYDVNVDDISFKESYHITNFYDWHYTTVQQEVDQDIKRVCIDFEFNSINHLIFNIMKNWWCGV